MRRRYKKKYLIIKTILFLILFSTIVGVSYSFLNQTLNISGNVSGSYESSNYIITPDSNVNLGITSFSTSKWKESDLEKTQYRFTVINNGNKRIDNFKMILNFNSVINSINIWNYDYTLSDNILTIINNNFLLPKGNQEVGFIVASKTIDLKIRTIKFEINESNEEVDPNLFTIVFNKTGGWGNYDYQYSVVVTNKTGKKIDFWQIEVILPIGTTYSNGWNAIFESNNNNLLIKCETYNCKITNNKTATFGLQLHTDIINYIPNNIKAIVR